MLHHLLRSLLLVPLLLAGLQYTRAQSQPFRIELEPIEIEELGGLHSYAVGQADGKWLLVGGRLDGLHRRQPWAAFDSAGHNNQLIVVDPVARRKWMSPLTSLPATLREHLSSTNMNSFQEGEYLYCTGGYGISATNGDHVTFPYLTAIHVPGLIKAIVNGTDINFHFRQLTDARFQVTGGRLQKIGNVFHLLGGHTFTGQYNPMNMPTFTQAYTNQIRRFTLEDKGGNIKIQHLESYTDTTHLHRRDFNAVPQILPNGENVIALFSGVFQHNADLPFLHSVTVDSVGYAVNDTFLQYFNHYHCPTIPLYSEQEELMHTLFFGGIAQYYFDRDGDFVQDFNVPFVKTISRVTRTADGKMREYRLPIEMPDFLGAGAEFIPRKKLSRYGNGVLKMDELPADRTLIGYIFGGIRSSQSNVLFEEDEEPLSRANSVIYKVYLYNSEFSVGEKHVKKVETLQFQAVVNQVSGNIELAYFLLENTDVKVTVFDAEGFVVQMADWTGQAAGEQRLNMTLSESLAPGDYYISLEVSYESASLKIQVK